MLALAPTLSNSSSTSYTVVGQWPENLLFLWLDIRHFIIFFYLSYVWPHHIRILMSAIYMIPESEILSIIVIELCMMNGVMSSTVHTPDVKTHTDTQRRQTQIYMR